MQRFSVSKGDNAGKALSALNQEDTIESLKSRIFQLEDEVQITFFFW